MKTAYYIVTHLPDEINKIIAEFVRPRPVVVLEYEMSFVTLFRGYGTTFFTTMQRGTRSTRSAT